MQLQNTYTSEWFDAVFSGMEEGVVITNESFVIQSVNPSFKQMLGYSDKPLAGREFFGLLKPEWSRDINYADFLQSQLLNLEEVHTTGFIQADHHEPNLFAQIRIRKIHSEGKTSGYLFFLKNSETESSQTKEIIENERKYHGLFENVLEGIFIFNNDGFIIDANPAACEIYHLRRDEFVGLSVADIFPHQSQEKTLVIWREFLNVGYLNGFYKYVLGNGEIRYIEFKSKTNYLPGLHLAVFSDVTEKTNTEKALRNSEANLKAMFAHVRQQFILLDPEYRIVTFNDAAAKATQMNLGRELKIGDSIFDYGQRGDREQFLNVYERVARGETIFVELNLQFSEDHWIEVGFIPVFDNKSIFKGTLLSVNDITSRKQAEINILEREARFRSLVQNSSDIITVLDEQLQIKYTSASIEKILGYKEEELVGKHLLSYIHEDDREAVKSILHKITTEESFNPVLEYRFLHADGIYVFLETACNNLLSNEYVKGIVLNTRDITERKYQEENLLLLERAIDSSNNGILISDPNQPDNPVIYVNKAFEQITGYSYFDTIGRNCRYLQKDDRNQPEITKMRNALEAKKEVTVVLRNYRKDGSLFWNQLSISPVFNRSGDLTNYIGVINDITERKLEEDALIGVTQGVSTSSDKNIFNAIVTHIGLSLQMDFVFIGEVVDQSISTKSFWQEGSLRDNIIYPLEGTPSRQLFEEGHCLHFENVSRKFPEDELLWKVGAHAYMGVPLKDSLGKNIGLLVAMSKKPFQNATLSESILNIFSVRASAEMERDYYIVALQSSEKRFRDLANNSPDIIYIIDLELRRVVYFNRDTIFGYAISELSTSEQWESIVHPGDVQLVKEHWKKFIESVENTNHGIEYRVRNKQGLYEWVANRHMVLERGSDGIPTKVLLNITLVTERKKTEEALRESEARLTALVENTNDIVWSVDKSLVFTAMNSSFRKLIYQYFGKEINVGDLLEADIPPMLLQDWVSYHKQALSGERFSVDFIVADKSGECSYEVSYNPIFSDEGFISGVSVFGRDITQRRNAENDIIRTNFELDSFVYRASHDLRAPLRSVLGLVNLAKSEPDEKERNNYLKLVEKSVNKLDTFISDLTNFSRNTRLEINVSKIDFRAIIDDCLENLKYMDNAERLRTIVQINEEADFYSDKTRINIIFQNIISNAIKYQNIRSEDSYLKIDIHSSPTFTDIAISDNGKGIREEYLDKIFNMFFRASQESYGSGLGLYITKQVIEKLSGTISVQSEMGVGTRFNIHLPNLK